jgi:hypothetical protein
MVREAVDIPWGRHPKRRLIPSIELLTRQSGSGIAALVEFRRQRHRTKPPGPIETYFVSIRALGRLDESLGRRKLCRDTALGNALHFCGCDVPFLR